jgi:hypothetical protein
LDSVVFDNIQPGTALLFGPFHQRRKGQIKQRAIGRYDPFGLINQMPPATVKQL